MFNSRSDTSGLNFKFKYTHKSSTDDDAVENANETVIVTVCPSAPHVPGHPEVLAAEATLFLVAVDAYPFPCPP